MLTIKNNSEMTGKLLKRGNVVPTQIPIAKEGNMKGLV